MVVSAQALHTSAVRAGCKATSRSMLTSCLPVFFSGLPLSSGWQGALLPAHMSLGLPNWPCSGHCCPGLHVES